MMDISLSAHAPLRIGTRRSNLAVVQAEGIRDSLQKIAPDRSYKIETLHALGDQDQSTALYDFGAKSLWTSELEEKLTSGQLDVITLPDGAVVGTSSVRRSAQPRRLYPHLRFANLRGNVKTRLAKVDDPASEYTSILMSAAGLARIGLQSRVNQYLGSKDGGIFHAVGQGALGLEIRKGDAQMQELLSQLADTKSTLACLAERSLMRTLEGGCSVPIGVETEWIQPDQLRISAIVVSLDGSQSVEDTLDARIETTDEADVLGQNLAARLVQAGAGAILNEINANRPAKD
ncbi:hypothetical protein BDW66DRAFT_155080 [Aspergillus desertorum]